MAIFMGDDKENKAVRSALAIYWAVVEVIRPAIEQAWSDGKNIANVSVAGSVRFLGTETPFVGHSPMLWAG